MKKKLFKGTFNYAGETYVMFTHAITEEWAFLNFTSQLSKKVGYKPSYVRGYFNGATDNYYIKEEVKEDESKDSEKDS